MTEIKDNSKQTHTHLCSSISPSSISMFETFSSDAFYSPTEHMHSCTHIQLYVQCTHIDICKRASFSTNHTHARAHLNTTDSLHANENVFVFNLQTSDRFLLLSSTKSVLHIVHRYRKYLRESTGHLISRCQGHKTETKGVKHKINQH